MKKIIFISLLIIVFVSCEKEVFTGLVETNITEFGKIFVSSNPSGYRVFIDNKNMGVLTPDTVLNLSEGTHRLNLKHDFYSDTTITINVNKSEVKILSIDMLNNPRFYGNVFLSTLPSAAKIYINDKLMNNVLTPTIIRNVYPGNYKFKFSKKDCREDSTSIFVKSRDFPEVFRILNDTSRGVDYRKINSNIASNHLTKVVIDKYNNKWIGSLEHGLIKYDGKNWMSYNNFVILNTRVNDILIDSKDRMWIATSIGLSVFDGFTWQIYNSNLPSNYVTSLEEDNAGNIWIGTFNGLVKYNNSTFQIYNSTNSGIPENFVTSIASAKNGDIWLGTSYGGIVRFSNSVWTTYNNTTMRIDNAISNLINDLAIDKNGILWAFHLGDPHNGTRNALTQYDGTNWKEFRLPIQFPVEISSFNIDSENNIWISAREGLIKYNEFKPIKYFNSIDYGFYVKDCYSTALDRNGDIWVATNGGGIIKLKKNNFN